MWPLIFACTDAGLTIKTGPPSVTIVEPGPDAIFWEGEAVTFEAVGGDDTTDPEALVYAWSAGAWDLVGEARVTEGGSAFDVPDGFPAGAYTVAVTVVDQDGEAGEDQVSFEVVRDDPPIVTWLTPIDGPWPVCAPIEALVFVSDRDTADLTTLTLTWAGLPAGVVAPAHPDAAGYAGFAVDPIDEGASRWEVGATDARGGIGSDAVDLDGLSCIEDLCNGVDDDDDGLVDEDAAPSTWFADADGDGHGDPTRPVEDCAQPEGTVSGGDDCDDTDAGVFPGAPESCNEVDDDCDGWIDEDLAETWYADADGDGHGDPEAPLDTCLPPSGYLPSADDCDDSDPAVFPGAEEICNEIDDDCDGSVDEGLGVPWYPDGDGDGHGDPALPIDACVEPIGYVPSADDCDDTDGAVFPGAAEACNTIDDDCDGLVDEDLDRVYFGSPTTGEVYVVDGSGVSVLVGGVGSVSALNLDPATDTLYIGQWDNPVTRRVQTDGTGLSSVYGGYGAGGQGVDVASGAGDLYWGEYYGDLRVGSTDGLAPPVTVLTRATVSSLIGASVDGFGVGLEVDESGGRIYTFTRSNASFAGRWIVRANLDGSAPEALRNIESMCLDVDLGSGTVYFGDLVGGRYQMWSMNLDGTGAVARFDLADGVTCSGVEAEPGGRLYYVQDGTGSVWSSWPDGSDPRTHVTGLPALQGIALGACVP